MRRQVRVTHETPNHSTPPDDIGKNIAKKHIRNMMWVSKLCIHLKNRVLYETNKSSVKVILPYLL